MMLYKNCLHAMIVSLTKRNAMIGSDIVLLSSIMAQLGPARIWVTFGVFQC